MEDNIPRKCAICAREVTRQDCHRNRYKEYICRTCQAKGHKFSVHNRLARTKRRVTTGLRWLAWTAFFALILGSIYALGHQPATH